MEYATSHLYFPYTHEPLGECVYEENTSDKWHVSRYSTRKHCITSITSTFGNFGLRKSSKVFGNLRKISGRDRKCS